MPVTGSNTATRALWEGTPCASLPPKYATSFAASPSSGTYPGIAPRKPWAVVAAPRGGTDALPSLSATKAVRRAEPRRSRSSSRRTSASDRTRRSGTVGGESETGALVGGDEVDVLRMVLDVLPDEGAVRDHRGAALSQLVQRARHEGAAEATTLERRVDLGVQEGVRLAVATVRREAGDTAAQRHLEALFL